MADHVAVITADGGPADARDRQLQGTPAWNQPLGVREAIALLPQAPGVLDLDARS